MQKIESSRHVIRDDYLVQDITPFSRCFAAETTAPHSHGFTCLRSPRLELLLKSPVKPIHDYYKQRATRLTTSPAHSNNVRMSDRSQESRLHCKIQCRHDPILADKIFPNPLDSIACSSLSEAQLSNGQAISIHLAQTTLFVFLSVPLVKQIQLGRVLAKELTLRKRNFANLSDCPELALTKNVTEANF